MEAITVQQYGDAIVNALSPRQIETLQILYYFPNASATAKELAKALNYSGFQAANRQIGQIGKAIAKHTGVMPPVYYGDRGEQPAYYFIIGEYYKNTGWNMWAELQEALENLNLVSTSSDDLIERLPTEAFQFDESHLLKEGKVVQVLVNRYERNQKARLECIKHHGDNCYVCGFSFGHFYGDKAKGFIHVHHKIPLAHIAAEYQVDPINDLVPLCANCHSVIHLANPALTIEELKKLIKEKN
ncbi:MAG: HNH endonuclease [Flavisolibacter sp.]